MILDIPRPEIPREGRQGREIPGFWGIHGILTPLSASSKDFSSPSPSSPVGKGGKISGKIHGKGENPWKRGKLMENPWEIHGKGTGIQGKGVKIRGKCKEKVEIPRKR